MISLQIKEDDKFFSRLVSRDSSAVSSSRRVYYGSAAASVPFLWETRPGTPKHELSVAASPPLTPPPSHASSQCRSGSGEMIQVKPKLKHRLLCAILPALVRLRKSQPQKLYSSSSISSSSSSSSSCSASSFSSSPSAGSWGRRRCNRLRSGSPPLSDGGEGFESPVSTLCVGVGCYIAGSVKKRLMSVVRHGSGEGNIMS